jgi:hypothetical protein
VNAKRFARKLRREVTASPKKAAVLGLLVLVALYFWGPLVWSWIARSESHARPAQAAAASEDARSVPSGPVPSPKLARDRNATTHKNKPPPGHPWDELARWIEADPRMKPAGELSGSRDPFHAVAQEVAKRRKSEELKAAEAAAAMTPEKLGLALSSTLIGPQRRLALISGRAYEQGRTVQGAKDGRQFAFTLSEVHPRRIVLTREGIRYELTIPPPASSGRLELYGSRN